MKLKRIIILGLVLACAGISHAADILTVKNVELAPGESVTLASRQVAGLTTPTVLLLLHLKAMLFPVPVEPCFR